MCGIVGTLVFQPSSFRVTESYLTPMREAMAHRGPDGAGTWIAEDGRVGFGHRRLSIIDLSEAAAQPMSNADGSLWVTYNGEIYNHVQIRKELEQIGTRTWKTDHSDTEVILHAFAQWGIACLEKFRGMFAIALWDNRARELWLIRDRIGIKPLYYSLHHGRLTFASEIKALLQDPEQPRQVDEEAFYHYLSFLTTPAPQTVFSGIKKLPGGTWLRVRENGDVYEQRYWDVWDHVTPCQQFSEEDFQAELLSQLREAVQWRKVSDVPVGIFLSGGIDSSTNAALFSENEQNRVKTFSIGYHGTYEGFQDELHYARRMAQEVGSEHHERLLQAEDVQRFSAMLRLQDEPIAGITSVPLYYVSEMARNNGVTVCQAGEGSDELFCGYQRWKLMLRRQWMSDRIGCHGAKKMMVSLLQHHPRARHSASLEWLRRMSLQQPIFWGGQEVFSEIQKQQLLSPHLRKQFATYSSWEVIAPIRSHFEERAWEPTTLSWMSYLDLRFRLPELLLMRLDKMSMAVGLEGRVPYLDHQLVEMAMSIPTAIKFKHGTRKYILKKAVRGLIPDEFIDRKKQGFGIRPIYSWLHDDLNQMATQELREFCKSSGLLDDDAVRHVMHAGRRQQIWTLLNFAIWWRAYIAS